MTALEDIHSGEVGKIESDGEPYQVKNISDHDWSAGQEILPEEIEIPERWQ